MDNRKTEAYRKYNREFQRKWRLKNRERYLEIGRKSQLKFQKLRNDRWTEQRRRIVAKLKDEMLSHYGRVCACCGESEKEFLTLDHINGGGGAHRKAIGGQNIYRDLKKKGWPSGYRVLCMNCNWATRFRKSCPHQKSNLEVVA